MPAARKLAVVDDPLATSTPSRRRRRSAGGSKAETSAAPAEGASATDRIEDPEGGAEPGAEAQVGPTRSTSPGPAAVSLEVVSARVPAPLGRRLARAAIDLSEGPREKVRVQEIVAALLTRYVVDDGDLVELGELVDDYRGG